MIILINQFQIKYNLIKIFNNIINNNKNYYLYMYIKVKNYKIQIL